MNEELRKALESLIEETIGEIDELKKSRFSAAEVKLDGPGADGIAGKPSNGHIEKDEDEDKDDEKKDKDMDKAEGKNKEADPGAIHHGEGKDKGAGPRELSGGGKSRSHEGKNSEADPGEIHHSASEGVAKADDDKKDDKKKDKDAKGGEEHEKKERKAIKELSDLADMDKADMDDMGYMKGDLMKSYIDNKVAPLEQKLSSILDLVNKIADQPVAPKGVTARMQPLSKSADEGAPLLKASEVSSKLFELKKSGTAVESLDVTKAELGQDLQAIVKKYNLA